MSSVLHASPADQPLSTGRRAMHEAPPQEVVSLAEELLAYH